MWNSLMKTCCFFLFFILLVGCGINTQNDPARARLSNTHARNLSFTSTLARSAIDFSKFAGVWAAHGALLIVSSDGTATFTARTYNWCAPGAASPCDSIDAQGHIRDGNQEQLLFSHVSGSTAYGTVTSSDFHSKGSAVTLTLQPNGTLLYASGAPIALLCGPAAAPGTCGA